MGEPQIVSPQFAFQWESDPDHVPFNALSIYDLAHTVATEPERIAAAERSAVVDELREAAGHSESWINERADAIENGADL